FQAEDGIRDGHVTGVQTCALPILSVNSRYGGSGRRSLFADEPSRSRCASSLNGVPRYTRKVSKTERPRSTPSSSAWSAGAAGSRSEECRVGEEGGGRWVLGPCGHG